MSPEPRISAAATGLSYYRARYYDPKVGRFISEDPIGFTGGVNFYLYVSGNPVRFGYPLGLVEPVTVGAGTIVGGLLAVEFGFHLGLATGLHFYFPGVEGRADLKRHCWVNCVSSRAHFNTAIPTLFSVGAELSRCQRAADQLKDNGRVDPRLLREIGEHLAADFYGQQNGWKVWDSCQTICEAVPGAGH
jgi:RHS repeat-associated protein